MSPVLLLYPKLSIDSKDLATEWSSNSDENTYESQKLILIYYIKHKLTLISLSPVFQPIYWLSFEQ
jgi:hypothetical protein